MTMTFPRWLRALVFGTLWLGLHGAWAATAGDERILGFHSDIRIEADGSMQVTETIRVSAEGINIRRGIYREFPTRYRDEFGSNYVVDFTVLDLTRNGRPEPWNAQRRGNGVRVDFGDDNLLSVPAVYEYRLRYRTTRQLGYFPDRDELYWNVTGVGWSFPIDQASATVTLPRVVPATTMAMEGYTGMFRARGQDYLVSISDGAGMIRTTQPLEPNEGLTLVLSWPKGVVPEPTRIERTQNVLENNTGVLLALLSLLGTFFYLAAAWSKVGRDPELGVIFPHYEPPAGIAPATARYVSRMGYDSKLMTVAIVDLAVHGYLNISQEGSSYRLQRQASAKPLSDDERRLLDLLFAGDSEVELHHCNHALINRARAGHSEVLRGISDGVHFLNNSRYLLPSILGSAVVFAIIIALDAFVPLVMVAFIVIVLLHAVFGWLLKAPTAGGRLLMDKLEGFKLYLDVAEKEEMNLRNPPALTAELFEQYLPFAMALGVEQHWGERFERAVAASQLEPRTAYHPLWYSGHFHTGNIGDFTRSVGSSFNSAISSASTPPGSSAGAGGGGSSGGGGGGGGGGGR
jgi:uncharacterized membrane protein YgcG